MLVLFMVFEVVSVCESIITLSTDTRVLERLPTPEMNLLLLALTLFKQMVMHTSMDVHHEVDNNDTFTSHQLHHQLRLQLSLLHLTAGEEEETSDGWI